MGFRYTNIAVHPPIYDTPRRGAATRRPSGVAHLVAKLADFFNPVRVCRRQGHQPGEPVYAYESWDLDHRYPGAYLGHACDRCGEVI